MTPPASLGHSTMCPSSNEAVKIGCTDSKSPRTCCTCCSAFVAAIAAAAIRVSRIAPNYATSIKTCFDTPLLSSPPNNRR